MTPARVNKVLFIGSKRLGLLCLDAIYRSCPSILNAVLTVDDRDDARSCLEELTSFCHERSIKLFVAVSQRDSEAFIRNARPEFCLVVGWYWLISKKTLESVSRGMIGLHNSLLPLYRGSSPLVWAILNRENEVGVSLFSFTAGMDDGEIWGQAAVSVSVEDTIKDVLDKIEQPAVELIRSCYLRILDGSAKSRPQEHSKATYGTLRRPDDGWIEWSRSARYVYDFIWAQTEPYPGAFTLFKGRRLTVWQASLVPGLYFGTPGQVARSVDGGAVVICGDNRAVLLKVVEFDGSREPGNTILKSLSIRLPTTRPS